MSPRFIVVICTDRGPDRDTALSYLYFIQIQYICFYVHSNIRVIEDWHFPFILILLASPLRLLLNAGHAEAKVLCGGRVPLYLLSSARCAEHSAVHAAPS